MISRLFIVAGLLSCMFGFTEVAISADVEPVQPGPRDKCPVCGMFVAKYPDWVAEILFADQHVVFFDGAKDLFKYYFKMQKYDSKRTRAEIVAIYVTEYYDLKLIDAKEAYYVIGSDVYGPMGHELIPLVTEDDVREFMQDHKGKQIVRFHEVTPQLIQSLD